MKQEEYTEKLERQEEIREKVSFFFNFIYFLIFNIIIILEKSENWQRIAFFENVIYNYN